MDKEMADWMLTQVQSIERPHLLARIKRAVERGWTDLALLFPNRRLVGRKRPEGYKRLVPLRLDLI